MNKLTINIKKDNTDDGDYEYIIISVDSTGIKVTNRGRWMNEKWNTQNREGYLKTHVAVNKKTKEILALEVTDEKVHDNKKLRKLVNHVLKTVPYEKNKVKKLKLILADGAHETNTNFGYLEKNGITPGIKVRKTPLFPLKITC